MTSRTDDTGFAMSRRTLLAGAGLTALLGSAALSVASASPANAALALVPDLATGAPLRTAFAPHEQKLAGYLKIVAGMANDIVDDGSALHGYMGGGWWRSNPQTYDARTQEQVSTLSWFYTNARSWNPYAGNAALLDRLDAAIGYYLELQHPNGSFPSLSAGDENRAATGFGLVALSQVLSDLRSTGSLPVRQAEVEMSLIAATTWFLNPTNIKVWMNPVEYTNQPVGGLVGAARALQLIPNATLSAQLDARIADLVARGQASAGFFHEPLGPDFGYNFQVALPDLWELYHLTGAPALRTMAESYAGWLALTALREPDGSGWIVHRAASARGADTTLLDVTDDATDRAALAAAWAQEIPALAAFFTSQTDRTTTRTAWAASSDPVAALEKGKTTPRIMIHGAYGDVAPTASAKATAIAALPYIASTRFSELRSGAGAQQYLFIRRPNYYVGSAYGAGAYGNTSAARVQRQGPGFLWHPVAGMLIHSDNNSAEAWGTLTGTALDAAEALSATFFEGPPATGTLLATPTAVGSSTTLGVRAQASTAGVQTDMVYRDAEISRSITGSVAATEQVPLILHDTDTVVFSNGLPASFGGTTSTTATSITVTRGSVTMTVRWSGALPVSLTATTRTFLNSSRVRHVLRISHGGTAVVKVEIS